MITHCPSCHTHFRVHAEQLAARAGQVRCGKCARVFDALEYLIEEIPPARAPGSGQGLDATLADTAEAEHAPEPAAAETGEFRGEAQQPAALETASVPAEPQEPPKPEAEAPQTPGSKTAMPEPASVDADAAPKAVAFHFGPAVNAEPAKARRRCTLFALGLRTAAAAAYRFDEHRSLRSAGGHE
jgi:predicted Zn finger-like uncharacterized protein